MLLHFFLHLLEELRQFSFVVVISNGGVEGNYLVRAGTGKDFLLIFVLEVSGHERSFFYHDAAFLGLTVLVEFSKRTTQNGAILIGIHSFGVTSLLAQCVELFGDGFLCNLDVVVIYGVCGVQFDVELWCESYVEDKSEVILLLNVLRFLLFAAEGLAEHVDLVFQYIIEEAVLQKFVHFIGFGLRAVHLLDQSDGYLACAETRHLHLAAIFLNGFFYLRRVIFFTHLDGDLCAYRACLVECNIHFMYLLCCILLVKNCACKGVYHT